MYRSKGDLLTETRKQKIRSTDELSDKCLHQEHQTERMHCNKNITKMGNHPEMKILLTSKKKLV